MFHSARSEHQLFTNPCRVNTSQDQQQEQDRRENVVMSPPYIIQQQREIKDSWRYNLP